MPNGRWIRGKGSKKKPQLFTPKLLDRKQVEHLKAIQKENAECFTSQQMTFQK